MKHMTRQKHLKHKTQHHKYKPHRRILHPKIVDAMHNQRIAEGFFIAGLFGLALGLFTNPSVTGAAIVESPELSSTAFFSTLIIIISFMMVWTGVMIYFMKVEVKVGPKI